MKTIIFFLLSSFISFSSYAQDPQLFENDWYLHKITINSVDFFPPGINGEATTIMLNINENNMSSTVCDTQGTEITNYDDVNNSFTVGFFSSLAVDCFYYENQIFQDLYFYDFFKSLEPTNIYQYQIDTGTNNSKMLTLSNLDSNQAIYGNEPLEVQSFNSSQFSVHPNPASETIILNSTNDIGRLKIKIYTTEGKLLNTQALDFNGQNSIDVSNLSSGIYLLSIEDEEGRIEVLKFVKE